MVKKVLVRGFVVAAVVATGGVALAAVEAGSVNAGPAAATAFTPKTTLAASEAGIRTAVISACGGRSMVTTLDDAQTAHVDHKLAERALHAASLEGNPLESGTGFQAGIDDALHIQALDRDIASVLCP